MKIFKKTVAAVSVLAMLASMAVVPMSAGAADTTVYSGDPVWTAVNGTSGTGTGYINGDSSQSTDTTYFYQGDGGGSRGGYAYFVDGAAPAEGNVYQLDWYMNLNASVNDESATSHVYLMGTNDTAAAAASSGAILDFYMTPWMGEFTVNGQSLLDDITIGSTSFYSIVDNQTRTSGTGLIKYSALIDFDAKQVTLTVNGTKATSTYTLDFVDDTVTSLYGFKAYVGRWYSGVATTDVTLTEIEQEVTDIENETLASVEFASFPSNGKLTAGPDANTAASNPLSVKITGSEGTDLTSNYDKYDVEYTLKGFRWVADKNEPSTDAAGSDSYCDSYGRLVVDETTHAADFQLKAHAFNYYGAVEAKVTYNGKSLTISKPLIYIGNATPASTNDVLPRGGYISDFNKYSSDMVGYVAANSSDNRGATDIITDNWATYGGNSKKLTLVEENGKKFMKLQALGTNSSCFAANQISAVTDSQIIISQKVRFYNSGSSILLKSVNPVTWNDNATSVSIGFDGSSLNINGNTIASASSGVWYKIDIISDVPTKRCYAVVYNEAGVMLGTSEVAEFVNAGSVNPTYYMFRTPDRSTGTLDFNDVKIYRATVDPSAFTVSAANETVAIPEKGQSNSTTTLSASAKTIEGYDMLSPAVWTIDDDAVDGVTVVPSADDSHQAVLTVEPGATVGEIPVKVTIGGQSKTAYVTLTSSQDSVKFTKSVASVSIPLNSTNATAQFEAVVVGGNGSQIAGKAVTYQLYDKNNANPVTLTGVTLSNGTLTVTSAAKSATVYVRATSTNSNNETISKSVKVVIHGLSFDFGEGTDEDIADGYTAVSPSTTYTEKLGYGIEGAAASAGTASTTDASTDYLTGTFTFKANVESNKIYTVNVYYSGSAASEYVNSDLLGVALTNDSMSVATYNIPVFDGVLDLAFTSSNVAYITIEKQADKVARTKPNVFSIGDSTIANNGSWAYVLNNTQNNYGDLATVATFSNNGAGSRNLSTYYTQGKLMGVLNSIRPGDYVMIGCIGTNGMGSHYKEDLNYYIDCCLALGAKVILNSYSPHGAVAGYAGGYNSSNQTFTSYRQDSYDVIVREVYAERKAELAGFIDIGKNADSAFNAYVDAYASNGHASRDAAAQEIIACFTDHNHYKGLASTLMIEGYNGTKGIVSELVRIIGENTVVPELAVITTEALAISAEEGSTPAKGWKAEFVQGNDNLQPEKLVWNISSTMGTAKTNPEVEISTTISGGATVRYGLVITGTVEQLESLTVEAELK